MANSFFDTIYKNKTQHTPDVLSCLSNLSNDEVFTPPDVVNQMLDLLPQELFTDPNTTFLDPACKTGVFLREIAKRLLVGLEDKIPDLQERIDHIFHKQLYGIAITELTSLLSRRSLYCSKYPNGPYSITEFDNPEGNIRYRRINHTWVNGKCKYCGVSKKTVLGSEKRKLELETHAYEWIHIDNPERLLDMKFDVIISNPPYQLDDGGNGASAKPIYHRFIEQAEKLNPRYLTMIIPARWYAGGKGLENFRKSMLNDTQISHLVDFVNAKDCFPGISIGGGVCYFLKTKGHKGKCHYTNIHDGHVSKKMRDLNEFEVFIRYNEAISIIEKVKEYNEDCFACHVGTRNPYGLSSSARGKKERGEIALYSSDGISYIEKSQIKQGHDTIKKYKVMISKVTAEHAGEPDKDGMLGVLSTTKQLGPDEVCTDSYLIAYTSDSPTKVNNCIEYMNTKFFRFLLLQAVSSINLSKDKFIFVPDQDYNTGWNDEKLYKKYNLSENEIDFIETMIKPKAGGITNGK